ncbi:hypothetical protein DICVIV_01033 [Dictyocaulus viviparus]|uniref:Uncharacterized protein n=1 Tax=Dictyocaulus viviparus TaxID=29172 RepID=A0A0D8YDY6_DICVI|nr:hypothetical protein DICVIV_01033 [Dictyocaulus viviparus]
MLLLHCCFHYTNFVCITIIFEAGNRVCNILDDNLEETAVETTTDDVGFTEEIDFDELKRSPNTTYDIDDKNKSAELSPKLSALEVSNNVNDQKSDTGDVLLVATKISSESVVVPNESFVVACADKDFLNDNKVIDHVNKVGEQRFGTDQSSDAHDSVCVDSHIFLHFLSCGYKLC